MAKANMAGFNKPTSLTFTGNTAEEWKSFQQRLNLYMIATGIIKQPEEVKVATLLNLAGDEAIDVFNTFNLTAEQSGKYSIVIAAFESYCNPRKNIIYERYKFYNRKKEEGESFERFLTDLKKLAKACEFPDEENMIRDRVVLGIGNESLQEKLLRDSDLTLKKAADYCRAAEMTHQQIKVIKAEAGISVVEKDSNKDIATMKKTYAGARTKQNYDKESQEQTTYSCRRCGRRHGPRACPAFGKVCNKCHNTNHFAIGCNKDDKQLRQRFRKVYTAEREDADSEVEYYIDSIIGGEKKGWFQDIILEGGSMVKFKLDTGAEISVLPYSDFIRLGLNLRLKRTPVVLVMYGGFKIKPLGVVRINCKLPGETSHSIEFAIAEVKAQPILSWEACERMNLIRKVEANMMKKSSDGEQTRNQFINQNSDLFTGLGKLPYKHKIVIKEEAEPVVKTPYRIPESLKDRLRNTLKTYEKDGVITRVDKPTDWVHNLVIREKPNGTLRLCLNPSELNKVLKREHYEIPTVEELVPKLSGKTVYTILDMKDGFFQIELEKGSSELCTFACSEGRFKFNRLPFGLASAPEVFQKVNTRIFGDIKGVQVYFDDLIIAGRDNDEHDIIMEKVLERARQNNVKFNRDKLQYKVKNARYMGYMFSEKGMETDKEQVEAILALEEPTNKGELQKLLGMVTFLVKFIPQMAETTAPLRELLKKDKLWDWTYKQTEAVSKLKRLISQPPVLKVFDPTKEITIQCDSSQNGLGCCLLQGGQPVSYGSRSLNETEKRYAQIEKEMLSICYAVKRFHTYIYGRKVLVQNDHKPLENIMKKDIGRVSARLQRMYLQLLRYELTIRYIPGPKMYIADQLSRSYIKKTGEEDPEMLEKIHGIGKEIPVSLEKLRIFQTQTQMDADLNQVSKYCLTEWPTDKSKIKGNLNQYWKLREKITSNDGILFLEEKIIVPESMRREMMNLLHGGHFGEEKTKARARQILYWPGMSQQIEDLVRKCRVCERYRKKIPKEPIIQHELPGLPFEKLGCDICTYAGQDYLIVGCYLTKWLEIIKIKEKTSREVISKLKTVFTTHGIPQVLMSDNVPFSSYEFQKFCREWMINHITSSPNYPQSNGLSEKMVGIAKDMIRKSTNQGRDLELALMEYRVSPITGIGQSPSQMLMSRMIRTKIPTTTDALKPRIGEYRDKLTKEKQRQKKYYNRNVRSRREFGKEESILFRKDKVWEPGIIIKKADTPRSYVVGDSKGHEYRRTKGHIRQSYNPPPKVEREEDMEEGKPEDMGKDPGIGREYTRSGREIKQPLKLSDYVLYGMEKRTGGKV